MWRLAVLVLAAVAGTADAFVMEGDPIVHGCGHRKTWSEVSTCLEQHGEVTLERELAGAKLVRVVQTEDDQPTDLGIYLYVQAVDGSWSVGGTFHGARYGVRALARETIEKHTGFRIVVGQLARTRADLGDGYGLPVVLQTQRTLYCSGIGHACADVTTHCDVIYRGKALWTFRGTLARDGGVMENIGDRSRGGRICLPAERVPLGWPMPKPEP